LEHKFVNVKGRTQNVALIGSLKVKAITICERESNLNESIRLSREKEKASFVDYISFVSWLCRRWL